MPSAATSLCGVTNSIVARQWGALLLLAATVALDIGSVAVVNPALPEIGRTLGMHEELLQWTVTAYSTAFAGCLLLGGRLADVCSRRFVLMLGVGVFTAGSAAAGLAGSALPLIAARVLQGVGAAVSVPAAMALLFQVFPPGPARNRALGVYTSVGASSFGIGLVAGGVLTDALGWPAVFGLSAVLGLLVLAGAGVLLPRSGGHRRPVDLPGAMLVTFGMLATIYAVTRAGAARHPEPDAWLAAAVAVTTLAGFVCWERRAAHPLFPVRVLRSRPVRAATLAGALFFFALNGFLFFASLYLQGQLGYSPLWSALAVLPMSVLVALGSAAAGRLLSRFGQRPVLVAGLLLMSFGIGSWARTPPGAGYWIDLLPGILVMSFGQGLAYTAFTAASLTGVPERSHGVAGAFNVTAQQLGASLGTATLVALAAGRGQPDGYHPVHLTIAILLAAGAVATGLLFGGAARPAPHAEGGHIGPGQ